MDFLKKLFFREKTEEEEKIEEKADQVSAVMIENEFACNGCGELIEGKPRFINHQGRRLVFHKKCLKNLSMGNL